MYLQDFLREHNDWEEILGAPPYNLKWERDKGFILFKYNQFDSDFSIPLVQDARGIIFEEKTWEVVCFPFRKFGNYGEFYVKPLDWKGGVSVQEKIDGSLMKVWNYEGKWHLSTNGMIDAFKTETGLVLYPTFGNLFERALSSYGYNDFTDFCSLLNPNRTYMFELATEENRVVVPYKGFHLFYLGERDNHTFKEYNYRAYFYWIAEIEVPHIYEMKTLEDVIAAADALSYDEEGYVVVDKHWNRCKIKSPEYVKVHYVRNNGILTRRAAVEILLAGEQEEFLIYAPEKREALYKVNLEMVRLKELCYDAVIWVKSQKYSTRAEYAKIVEQIPDKTIRLYCFYNFDEEVSFEEFTEKWDIYKWERVLERLSEFNGFI